MLPLNFCARVGGVVCTVIFMSNPTSVFVETLLGLWCVVVEVVVADSFPVLGAVKSIMRYNLAPQNFLTQHFFGHKFLFEPKLYFVQDNPNSYCEDSIVPFQKL